MCVCVHLLEPGGISLGRLDSLGTPDSCAIRSRHPILVTLNRHPEWYSSLIRLPYTLLNRTPPNTETGDVLALMSNGAEGRAGSGPREVSTEQ